MRRRRLAVIAVVVLAVCAGAGAWTLSLRDATVRTAFIGHADQVCGDYHDAVAGLGRPGTMADVPGASSVTGQIS